MPKRYVPYLIILMLLLPIMLPQYSSSILGSADNLAHLFRVVNLDAALREGYIWPRWAGLAGHGFGAPVFNFNYMLPYYLVVGLWRLCGSLLHGSQWYMMLTILGSGYAMYALMISLVGMPAAIVAAVAYAYMPYHLMVIYLYGGYGEALAFVWAPLVLLHFYLLFKNPPHSRYAVYSVIFLSLLILTHNLSALLTMPLIFTLFLVAYDKKRLSSMMVKGIGVVGTSAALTAWFWLPSIAEESLTKLSLLFEKETAMRGYFFQLIKPLWNNSFDALALKAPGYYSYAIGIPTVIIVGLSICVLIKYHSKLSSVFIHRIGVYFLLWFGVSLLATRQFSEPLWHLLPPSMNFLSYPYRFFFLNTIAVAGLVGYVVHVVANGVKGRKYNILVAIMMGAFIWQGYIYSHPNIDRFNFKEEYFRYEQTVRSAPFTYKNMGYIEFIPTTADSSFVNGLDNATSPLQRAELISGSGAIFLGPQKTQEHVVNVTLEESSDIRVNILYFPGWIGRAGGRSYLPKIDSQGRMIFTLPKGEYEFHVVFTNTPIRTFASIISIATLCVFGVWIASLGVKSMKSHVTL